MQNILALAVLLFAMISSCPVGSLQSGDKALPRGTATRRQAELLWEQAIAAKGGRDRLEAVESLLVTSGASKAYPRRGFEGLHANYVELYVFPDRFWQWFDDRPSKFGLYVQMFDGKRNEFWLTNEDDPQSPRLRNLEAANYELVRRQITYLMETKWLKPVPTRVARSRVGGKQVDVLYALAGGYKAVFFLDKTTHLPLKVAVLQASSDEDDTDLVDTLAVVLGGYSEVEGIQMPQKLGFGREPDVRYGFGINVDYDPSVFTKPPTIQAGPDGWKKRPHD